MLQSAVKAAAARAHLFLVEAVRSCSIAWLPLNAGQPAGKWPGRQVEGRDLQIDRHHHAAVDTQRLTPAEQRPHFQIHQLQIGV